MPNVNTLFDKDMLVNIGMAAPVGLAGGGIMAILIRKLEENRMKEMGFTSPESRVILPTRASMPPAPAPLAAQAPTPMPLITPAEEQPKKRKTKKAAMGHIIGGVGGGVISYHLVSKMLAKREGRMLDAELAKRDQVLNELLTHEQALAAGVDPKSVAMATKVANSEKFDKALVTYAGKLYDTIIEKQADMGLRELLEHSIEYMRLGKNPFFQMLMATSGLAGLGAGYYAMSRADPSRAMAEAVKGSLKERLTGKDQLIGPMPIRVETETPMMTPIRPGASALVDPSKGRDVLEGI